jgi:hypothetical protein
MSDIKINKMNVAQVRRALNILRTNWENHSPQNPFCLSEEIDKDLTFSDFCFDFVMNHHSKRQIANKEIKKNQV